MLCMLARLSATGRRVGLQGGKPPTTVSCAPRKMALGSKFDIVQLTRAPMKDTTAEPPTAK